MQRILKLIFNLVPSLSQGLSSLAFSCSRRREEERHENEVKSPWYFRDISSHFCNKLDYIKFDQKHQNNILQSKYNTKETVINKNEEGWLTLRCIANKILSYVYKVRQQRLRASTHRNCLHMILVGIWHDLGGRVIFSPV